MNWWNPLLCWWPLLETLCGWLMGVWEDSAHDTDTVCWLFKGFRCVCEQRPKWAALKHLHTKRTYCICLFEAQVKMHRGKAYTVKKMFFYNEETFIFINVYIFIKSQIMFDSIMWWKLHSKHFWKLLQRKKNLKTQKFCINLQN